MTTTAQLGTLAARPGFVVLGRPVLPSPPQGASTATTFRGTVVVTTGTKQGTAP